MKTLGLSFLVALGTLIAMAVVGLGFFTGGGIIFPSIVAWVAASVFAWERRPRHVWLHVAAIGVMVAALLSLFFAIPKLFPPPPGYMRGGGPNVYPPAEQDPARR
jgi:hypothetical protein